MNVRYVHIGIFIKQITKIIQIKPYNTHFIKGSADMYRNFPIHRDDSLYTGNFMRNQHKTGVIKTLQYTYKVSIRCR